MDLLIALENSGSFARTHSIIAQMSKYEWSPEDRETLFTIAVENGQVFCIIEDEDLKRFYKKLLKGIKSLSVNAEKIKRIIG